MKKGGRASSAYGGHHSALRLGQRVRAEGNNCSLIGRDFAKYWQLLPALYETERVGLDILFF